MAKCVKTKGKVPIVERLSDQEAADKVSTGQWEYTNKDEWKRYRDRQDK